MINKALEFIKRWEGFRSAPYLDSAGIPTIGYGTIEYDNGVKVSMLDQPIDKLEAERLLTRDILKRLDKLESFLRQKQVDFNDNQKVALLSFCYNLGFGPVVTDGRSMCEAIKSKDIDKVADAFLLYNKATVNGMKIEIKGLTNRRIDERRMFLS